MTEQQMDGQQVYRRVIPESGLVLIRVTVKDGLRRMFWKFRLGDGFDVWLDSYWVHERKNKADKWTETSQYATANAEAATLQPSAVPIPDWIWDLATMTIRTEMHQRGVEREADRVVRQKVKRAKV